MLYWIVLSTLFGFLLGESIGERISNRRWTRITSLRISKLDDQLMRDFGMSETCINCGCQETDQESYL